MVLSRFSSEKNKANHHLFIFFMKLMKACMAEVPFTWVPWFCIANMKQFMIFQLLLVIPVVCMPILIVYIPRNYL